MELELARSAGVNLRSRRPALLPLLALVACNGWASAQQPGAGTAAPPPMQRVIEPGVEWNPSGDEVPAGAEIRLARGVHPNAVLAGLRGTAEAPIRIVGERSADDGSVVMIVGGEIGLELRDCRHVEVDGVMFIGQTKAAIRVIDSEGVRLSNAIVARLEANAGSDGIEVVRGRDFSLRSARFDGWSDAAIDLRDVEGVSLDGVEFVGMAGRRNRVGVRFGGSTSNARLERFAMRRPVIAVQLGEPTSSDPTSPPPCPRSVSIRDGLIDQAVVGASFGSVMSANVERVSIVGSRIPILVDGTPRECRFERNIVTWSPGAMQAFGEISSGGSGAGLTFGENLWWSAELPAALPLLGSLPGVVSVPQLHEPDPRLDDRGIPAAPAAKEWGRPSP